MSLIARLRTFFYQSQEFTLWLPGLSLLAVAAFIVLGAIARIGTDSIAFLLELPAMCAYALAAFGLSWVIKSLYLHDIDRAEEVRLQALAEAGDTGARWVLVKDRIETFACLALMLAFLWPAR